MHANVRINPHLLFHKEGKREGEAFHLTRKERGGRSWRLSTVSSPTFWQKRGKGEKGKA